MAMGPTVDNADYPTRYATPDGRSRQYLWVARLLAVVAFASIMLNIGMGALMIGLFPLKEVRPLMVQFTDRSDTVATITPLTREMPGLHVLTEALVRQWVIDYHLIPVGANEETMTAQWGANSFFRKASTDAVYNDWYSRIAPLIPEASSGFLSTRVEVKSVLAVEPLKDYQIRINKSFWRNGAEVPDSRFDYTIHVGVGYRHQADVKGDAAFINPTGFTIISYRDTAG